MGTKSADKKMDRRIEAAYYRSCTGLQINIMDIGKVFEYGRHQIADGADDAQLAAGLRAYVEKLAGQP